MLKAMPKAPDVYQESRLALSREYQNEDNPEDVRLLYRNGLIALDNALIQHENEKDAALAIPDFASIERARPDMETLLQLIEAALPAAERVDIGRGRCLPETVEDMETGRAVRTADYLGSRGTDYAEELVQLRARLSLELYGPTKQNRRSKTL
jgi:hypothetical protein